MQIQFSPQGRRSRWTAQYDRVRFLALWTIVLTCVCALARTPTYAATSSTNSTPMITWDASMIYSDQNTNAPWGPVGENAIVHGSNFAPTPKLFLLLVPGDSNENASLCAQTGVNVASVSVNSTGKFSTSFLWPATTGKIGQKYSICAQNASHTVVSSHDSSPFTVLAGSPTVHISPSNVATGSSVTITGQHWVPPQAVTIVIGNCGTCIGSPSNTFLTRTVISSGLNAGVFTTTLTIPMNFSLDTYAVEAYAHLNTSTNVALLDASKTMPNGLPHLTIAMPSIAPVTSSAATPTVTPTATAIATIPAAPTVVTPRTNVSTTLSTPNTPATSPFPFILVLGLLLLLIVTMLGLLIYTLRQRRLLPALLGRMLPAHAGSVSPSGAPTQTAYAFQQSMYAPYHEAKPFTPEPTQPQNYPSDRLELVWAQNYFDDVQQPTEPRNYAYEMRQAIELQHDDDDKQPITETYDYAAIEQQPTAPQSYVDDIQQPTEPRHYAHGAPQPLEPQDDPTTITNQEPPREQIAYGAVCFTCSAPLPADSQFCRHCGTHNGDFFA